MGRPSHTRSDVHFRGRTQGRAIPLAYRLDNVSDDIGLAEYLLDAAGVALVPGSAFGAPGYVRLSFATGLDVLEDALARLTRALTA